MTSRPNARLEAVYRHLHEEYDIDGPELQELVQALKINLQELRQQMHSHFTAENRQALSRVGHSIKGVAANTGQQDLQSLGLELERRAPEGDRDLIAKIIGAIDAILREFGIE